MKTIIFVASGETNKEYLNYHYLGFGREIVPLTDKGKQQAVTVAEKIKNDKGEIIISSPYTRALEAASIISRRLNIDLEVEPGLHDWIPKDPYDSTSDFSFKPAYNTFIAYNGKHDPLHRYRYESLPEMKDRVIRTLDKYLKTYEVIIVVSHSMVSKVFDWDTKLEDGEFVSFEL